MKELAPIAAKLLIEDGYTVGTDLGVFTSGRTIRKGCITSMLLVVYEKRISYAKEKKGHVGLIAERYIQSLKLNGLKMPHRSRGEIITQPR